MKRPSTQGVRAALITASLIVVLALGVGLVWSWFIALSFFIGSAFFAVCCFLSYYLRIAFSFNNLSDPNMSASTAYLTNSIPLLEKPPRPGSETDTFTPFTFKQDKEKELEDMRVRAILRQVFSDTEIS